MLKILAIEDEAPLLEEVLDALRFENFDAIGAENGLIGLQLAREHVPDLIVCDVMMPELDGYEVLQDLRSDSNTLAIPFIFLTARTDKSDRRKGMELGADDYLTKPFTNAELLSAIRARLAKQAATEAQQLRVYAHKLVTLQEIERRQIAQRLQNELGQLVTGLQLTLDVGARLPPETLQGTLNEARELVARAAAIVNDTAQDLWPAVLDHLGLLPALFWQFERHAAKTGVSVNFRHSGLERFFDPAIKTGVYRVIQEALDNVAQHAGVSEVTAQVWVEDQILHARIVDEGAGFNLDEAFARETSVGLIAMRERIVFLNGDLSLVTAPEHGTQLLIKIPVDLAPGESPTDTVQSLGAITIGQNAEEFPAPPITPGANDGDIKQVACQRPNRAGAPITVILADGNEIMRRGLKGSLEGEPDIVVIAEVDHRTDILAVVEQHKPDVLMVDLALPGIGGLDITRQLSQRRVDTRVLILSSFREEAYFLETFRAGASGYVLKSAAVDDLVQAVRDVSAGRRYLSPALAESALESYIDMQRRQKDTALDTYGTLTNREREILHLVLDGYTNAEIAEQLVISPRTAETHRANMMRKLGLRNHRELLRYALRRGIITADR